MLWVIVGSLVVVAGLVAWWSAGRQTPERILGKRGQNFGPDAARDHVLRAEGTYGTGRKGRFSNGK